MVRDVATSTKISKSSVHTSLQQELNMQKVCLKMVPKVLTPEQKLTRVFMAETLPNDLESNDSLLSRIITGNESWVFEYDPSTKRQTMQWKTPEEPRHKKSKYVSLAAKGNDDIFFFMFTVLL